MNTSEKNQLIADFRSGKNVKAYLPLVNQLRKEKNHRAAVELCKEGLSKDSSSASAHIQLARLYTDLSRYSEAMEHLEHARKLGAHQAVGYLEVLLACQIKLHAVEEAEETLGKLREIDPFSTQTQVLSSELSLIKDEQRSETKTVLRKNQSHQLSPVDLLKVIEDGIKPLTKVLVLDLFDLNAGKFLFREQDILLEQAIELHEEVTQASTELDYGHVRYTLLELRQSIFFVVQRSRYILFAAFNPDANVGKIQHRVFLILDRHLGDSASLQSARSNSY